MKIGDLVTDIYPVQNGEEWDYSYGDTGIIIDFAGKYQCPLTAQVYWSCGTVTEISKDDLTVISKS